jgi:hypothetical protein
MSANINLSNIGVTLDLQGSVDIGLDDINATVQGGVDIGLDDIANALTQGVKADVGLDKIGITVGGGLDVGLGHVKADLGLNDIRIKEVAPIQAKVDLGLDNIRIRELPPIKIELSLKPIRIHLPVNFIFCFELFGIRLFKFSICGEGMTVAEDYAPHATERCQ